MNKMLVEIYVPAAKKNFDMLIPRSIMMYEAVELISKIAAEISEGIFVADKDTVVCRREDGAILNINLSVRELGLKHGSRLMLI